MKKVDRAQQKLIIAWIEKNLIHVEDPRDLDKSFKGDLKPYRRYCIGNYRVLVDINDYEIKIIIFNIGHRKDIYE